MMEQQKYLQSGNLEAYCLGLLNPEEVEELRLMCSRYPEVKQELEAIEIALETMALQAAVAPPHELKERLLKKLGLEQTVRLDLQNLPVINEQTYYGDWLGALAHLIPKDPVDAIVFQPLTQTPQLTQSLVYSRMSIPEETHEDLIESFFILEGSCRCMVDGKKYILNPGDFLEIPLYVKHDITLLTPHILAILQQQPQNY
jgi:mannose-6-phosphate isomerase-like protein (cupin superfamily)